MGNTEQFLIEYQKLCRKYKIIIDSAGWGNLMLVGYVSKKELEKHLQEHIKHYKSHG